MSDEIKCELCRKTKFTRVVKDARGRQWMVCDFCHPEAKGRTCLVLNRHGRRV